MYDIAALQALYGANFSKLGTDRRYSWDATTGQETINGAAAPDTGVTATNKIFSTIWTQGAAATYDLSNFGAEPGRRPAARPLAEVLDSDQLADLNSDAPAGTPQFKAQGNIYNALLYNGDTALADRQHHHRQRQRHDDRQRPRQQDHAPAPATTPSHGAGGNDTVSGGAGADTIDMSAAAHRPCATAWPTWQRHVVGADSASAPSTSLGDATSAATDDRRCDGDRRSTDRRRRRRPSS